MRIRQIVFAARDLHAASDLLKQVLGLGKPFPDPGVAEFGIDNAVLAFGDQFIEVISPNQAGTACGRHLDRHGDSAYMLLLQTDDFAREKARWAALGVRTIWDTAFDDITAAHLHPKDVGCALVSVDEPRPAASWRWGGPDWTVAPGAAGRQRIIGIELQATDAQATAQRWAQVFDLPAPTASQQSWRLQLQGGFVDVKTANAATGGDSNSDGAAPSISGVAGVAGFTLAVADPAAVLAAARSAGLPQSEQYFDVLGARIQIAPLES